MLKQKGRDAVKQILTRVMDIGEQMLIYGAEVNRVEESVIRMAHALGAKRIEIFIITTSMVATIYDEEDNSWSQTRRINSTGIDYEKIHRLNDLSRRVCEEKPTPEQMKAGLENALDCRSYPFWLECLAYSVIAAAFTLFFGGGTVEALVSLAVGALTRFVILFTDKAIRNKMLSKFMSSLIATILAYAAHKTGIIDIVDAVIIGNIMTLIPGIGLTNAFRDLFTGDSISGLLRTIEAALTALAIAAGYFIVAYFGGAVL